MMNKGVYIAALDLGTSKIRAMIARKSETGVLSVVASEQVNSDNCIRRGCVFNIDETTQKVSQLIRALNRKVEAEGIIDRIYVGINGQSIHSEAHKAKRIVSDGVVTKEIIDLLLEEGKDYAPSSLKSETLDLVSPEFYLDGQLEHKPKGATCAEIEARFQLILGSSALKKTLISAIEFKAKIEIAGFFISPLATAEAVLTEEEKELGCALIEFGAGVTSVSVYKSGVLKHLAVIPLGGNVITKDITNLNMLEKEAEELKIKNGSALLESNDESDINPVIEARMDEILANVIDQIKESGYASALGMGIIITGGAAQLNALTESIRNKTGQIVNLVSAKRSLLNQPSDQEREPGNSTVIGLLALGTENCLKPVETKSTQPTSFRPESPEDTVRKVFPTDIFGNPIKEEDKKPPKTEPKPPKPPTPSKGKERKRKIWEIFGGMADSLFNEEDEDDHRENQKNKSEE